MSALGLTLRRLVGLVAWFDAFTAPCTPAECRAVLAERAHGVFVLSTSPSAEQPVAGWVSEGWFALRKAIRYRNTFQTYAFGCSPRRRAGRACGCCCARTRWSSGSSGW